MSWMVGVDIGGTFTDMVVMDQNGSTFAYKTPTNSGDLIEGLFENLRSAVDEHGTDLETFLAETSRVAHGTTAATNAYIERRGAKVGLITTRGFEDTIFMQRMLGMTAGLSAGELTDYSLRKVPEPICLREMVYGVRERIDYSGEVVGKLREDDVRNAARAMVGEGVEAVAVSLLWSFKNPAHEQRVVEILREEMPDVYLSVSSEVAPRLGEYERTATTLVNAYLGPPVHDYCETLAERLPAGSIVLLDSAGGVMTPMQADRTPVKLLLSGPSGGVTAAQYVSAALGHKKVLTFDMGGTSADVGIISDGDVIQRYETESGGYHLLMPMIDVRAIGAGGGSIARIESGGYLRVGPESAGAQPGPACYARGGEMPTVTDADLVLGILDPDNFLGGRLIVDAGAARSAINRQVAEPLGISIEEAAVGIKQVVDTRMADLLRTVTLERGHDPREFVLYAFGGAGASHAPAFALDLVETVLIPANQAVLCAFGAIASDLLLTAERSAPMRLSREASGTDANVGAINGTFAELEERVVRLLDDQSIPIGERHLNRIVEVRFVRQTKTLSIPMRAGIKELLDDFLAAYRVRYGNEALPEKANFELVTFLVEGRGSLPLPRFARYDLGPADPSAARVGERKVYDSGSSAYVDTEIYDGRKLGAGNDVDGPAVIQFPDTTIAISSGQRARVDDMLNIAVRKVSS